MLNLSEKNMPGRRFFKEFEVTHILEPKKRYILFSRILGGTILVLIIMLFLPWTQTIRGKGYVINLEPGKRPQTLQSPIPGQIEKWFVNEGDFVKKGDTILEIKEVKSKYFDNRLLERTQDQINAKSGSVNSYGEKVQALKKKMVANQNERNLKLEQARNKLKQAKLQIESDSIALESATTQAKLAKRQLDRSKTLNEEGLKSKYDVEQRKTKQQETQAKKINLQNKLLASRNKILNAEMEINRIRANYKSKINDIKSKISTTQSLQFSTQAEVSKLENTLSNYKVRKGLYILRAPQDGVINKAIITGIGETFKEGEALVNLVPKNTELAVETYVDPVDLPLIKKGKQVQIKFDGWPSVVFSGWPNTSVGTFGGEVVAIESFMSTKGKYRILLRPKTTEFNEGWPEALRVGAGSQTLFLLDDVPIWYEIWRKINGFPPNYYPAKNENSKSKKKK